MKGFVRGGEGEEGRIGRLEESEGDSADLSCVIPGVGGTAAGEEWYWEWRDADQATSAQAFKADKNRDRMARKNKPIQAPAVAADVVGVQEENQRFEAPSLDIRGRGRGVRNRGLFVSFQSCEALLFLA